MNENITRKGSFFCLFIKVSLKSNLIREVFLKEKKVDKNLLRLRIYFIDSL